MTATCAADVVEELIEQLDAEVVEEIVHRRIDAPKSATIGWYLRHDPLTRAK